MDNQLQALQLNREAAPQRAWESCTVSGHAASTIFMASRKWSDWVITGEPHHDEQEQYSFQPTINTVRT